MILLQLSGIAKVFGEDVIIRDVNLTLQNGERVGLVGSNGSGKSTILRIIAGEWEADEGTVDKPANVRIGYLPQSARVSGERRLFDEMAVLFDQLPQTEPFEYKIRRALHGVGLPEPMWQQPTQTLSGGEKCRAALARVLLSEPDVLLLDEPTNHLDLEGRIWLEQYLYRFGGAVLLVAHDRVLLNQVTNRTAFLLSRTLQTFKGNYNSSREQWEAERDRLEKLYHRQEKEIARQEEFIRRNIAGQKTKQAQSRRKALGKLERLEKPEKEDSGPKIDWASAGRSRSELFRLENAKLGYDDKVLADAGNLVIYRDDRIGIMGANGSGKSTLLKTLLGKHRLVEGRIVGAPETRVSYFQQEIAEKPSDLSVEQHFWNSVPGWTIGQVRGHLAKFLFRRDEVEKSLRGLSGGERRRLEIAILTIKPAHLLILDEPTNHLDILAQEAVEEALLEFEGSILLVSHDRQLLDTICQKLWVFKDGEVKEHLGNYSTYAGKVSEKAKARIVKAAPSKKSKNVPLDPRNQKKHLMRQVAEAEEKIARIEAELATIDEEGHNPATAQDWQRLNRLSTEKRKRQRELDKWMTIWDEVSQKLAEMESEAGST